ncbi:metal-dependent hydrolase, partial [Bacillus sp. D-CC]
CVNFTFPKSNSCEPPICIGCVFTPCQLKNVASYIDEENKTITYTGMPAGILFTAEEKTLYHAGDTALFSDMKLIGELNNIDVAFLPIGDNFTMGPEDAVLAAKWVQAKTVVPMHYNTFPIIEQDPYQFVEKLQNKYNLYKLSYTRKKPFTCLFK